MNLREALFQQQSRIQMLRIVDYVSDNPKRLAELVKIFSAGPYRITQRAAWPLSYCAEKYPRLLEEHLPALVAGLKVPHHNAVTRNVLRLLQFIDIPDNLTGEIMNFCFDRLSHPKEPVANQAFAMSILANLAERYPEIKNEILLCIEERMPTASPGFKSRAKLVKKQLKDQ